MIYYLTNTLLVLSLSFSMSCGDDPVNPVNPDDPQKPQGEEPGTPSVTLKVGQSYQGGIIAYIDGTGKHGLIAAATDISDGVRWNNGTDFMVTTSTAVGTGGNNTERIVGLQGDGVYAAKLCYDLVLNGFSDWFLPSSGELRELWTKRLEIGGFENMGNYWSSSELPSYYFCAYYLSWVSGDWDTRASYAAKSNIYRVRPCRYF